MTDIRQRRTASSWKRAMALKAKAVMAALQGDHHAYATTRDPRHVWQAWQLARQEQVSIPEWVLEFIDRMAEHKVTIQTRKTKTADRYEAALTQMQVAIDAHTHRLKIRAVGQQLSQQLGKPITATISRRDQPNLSAIARAAAKANGVSVNRLLDRYRRLR